MKPKRNVISLKKSQQYCIEIKQTIDIKGNANNHYKCRKKLDFPSLEEKGCSQISSNLKSFTYANFICFKNAFKLFNFFPTKNS